MIKLYTDKLIIRDTVYDDLQNYYKLMSNDNVMKYTLKKKQNNIEETKQDLLKKIEETNSLDRKIFSLIIENKYSNEFIGEIGYKVSQDTPYGKLVNFGYNIMEKHWNHGYTTDALKRLIKYMFEEGNVYRISAGCIKENIGSVRVMEKCCLKKEGEYREYCFHEGKLKDWVEYGLLKFEWNK